MSRDIATLDPVERLALLPPVYQLRVLEALSQAQAAELATRWSRWAHPGQRAPAGAWRVWMIRAGRGFGKTRAGAEWISAQARADGKARIALVGATVDDVRRVMIEGESGLLEVARAHEAVRWVASAGEVQFPSGARAHVFSAGSPEKLRGPQHHAAWCDELGKWGRRGELAWHNLMMGMRAGDRPRVLVTTTPRPVKLMRQVMAMPGFVETLGRTRDNRHLPESFIAAMLADYADTRLGQQELDGEMLEDVVGALWSRALIERCRVAAAPRLKRVVVGVDPPASATGDACGIVAVGLGRDDHGYVLEDASVGGLTPEGWSQAVAACAARHDADRVVAEKNQGGEMVGSVLRMSDAGLPVTLVHAREGKSGRAEPVSLLYERGRVHHVGALPALEEELCGLQVGGGYEGPGRSPDRADALVWALGELMLQPRGEPGVQVL
jgi:phage terminase large subunit-like protein